jgi:FkbM family methyltransferase
MFKIEYGSKDQRIDVTNVAYQNLKSDDVIFIPKGDVTRGNYFTDPAFGTLKSIFITNDNGDINEFDHSHNIYINCITHEIYFDNIPYNIKTVVKIDQNILKSYLDKIKICYGTKENNIDITKSVIERMLLNNTNIIVIPRGNDRVLYFGDPLPGSSKSIFIYDPSNIVGEYNDSFEVYIHTNFNINLFTIYSNNVPDSITSNFIDPDIKIENIHSKLKLNYGSFKDELPEQKMATRFITGKEKILEIGGNIGRNSLVMAHLLGENNHQLVVLESDPGIAQQLKHNRDINGFIFHIENSALSKKRLLQKGWETIQSDIDIPQYKEIKIINFEDLKSKYQIDFDTLVLDCEGAFYYILMDIPEILDNIKLIIMENDYNDFSHKKYVDDVLKNKGFRVCYSETGGWGPCFQFFYEVWRI